MDRRTFKILHIVRVTGCCLNCAKGRSCKWYYVDEDNDKYRNCYPNWKLVSKNRKQYERKPLIIEKLKYHGTRRTLKW